MGCLPFNHDYRRNSLSTYLICKKCGKTKRGK